ncbi:N-acetylglucosamine-6-phosphate deacetylase [Halocynthiibacter namhaensis]|uniref:N-acetylglucosamine-6-phosphate deacetylase n=1 Tax=Halocynthiibacter namhaensis TaxID=1290553 RepID=UPI0005799D0C|nr:N-acetylglucosamine-6-phosphate deacetylase [Halocynthiibacter namhaensis]
MNFTAYLGADIFDGTRIHCGVALLLDNNLGFKGIVSQKFLPEDCQVISLDGGTLVPEFVDLQVNGGGGVMFNDAPSLANLSIIAAAHATLGTGRFLPTLITDTPAHSRSAVDAVEQAIATGVEGIIGLHLEGPHLSIARKGAHDGSLVRPMDDTDLALVLDAAARLPNVMMTVASETVSEAQVTRMADAGVIVSLGHTDADFAQCKRWMDAGARCVTHLFNAMSQMGNRAPGLVGAALDDGRVSAGLIADSIHVHPASMGAAIRGKRGPGQMFLVTDAMAVAGSTKTEFMLNGRRILRRDGKLTLEDGTLAGADLDMAQAIRVLVHQVGIDLADALAMATSVPAGLLHQAPGAGGFALGKKIRPIWLDRALELYIL